MFLPEEKWSPRYDAQFYTIRMTGHAVLDRPPTTAYADPFGEDNACSVFRTFGGGGGRHTAVYYAIEVRRGAGRHAVFRRYSQFRLLCRRLDPDGRMGLRRALPPGTGPFHRDTDKFLEGRMEGLGAFLRGLLSRMECVNNPLIDQFLEIRTIAESVGRQKCRPIEDGGNNPY